MSYAKKISENEFISSVGSYQKLHFCEKLLHFIRILLLFSAHIHVNIDINVHTNHTTTSLTNSTNHNHIATPSLVPSVEHEICTPSKPLYSSTFNMNILLPTLVLIIQPTRTGHVSSYLKNYHCYNALSIFYPSTSFTSYPLSHYMTSVPFYTNTIVILYNLLMNLNPTNEPQNLIVIRK